jgi:hypothetical protein
MRSSSPIPQLSNARGRAALHGAAAVDLHVKLSDPAAIRSNDAAALAEEITNVDSK